MKGSWSFILKGGLLLTFGNVSIRFLGYVYRILMGRLLSPTDFGILNLALPLQFLVIILSSSGVAPSIARFLSRSRARGEDGADVLWSSFFYYGLLATFIGVLFYLLSPFIGTYFFKEPGVVRPLQIASAALPFGILVAVLSGGFQGLKRVDHMSAVLIIEQLARVLFALSLVLTGFGLIGAIGGSTLGFMLALPLAFFIMSRSIHFKFNTNWASFKEVFLFSLPTSATALSSFTLAYADIVILGFYLSPFEVGIYSAASPASRLIFAFVTALYAVLVPSVSELFENTEFQDIRGVFKRSLGLLSIVVVPSTMVSWFFASELITILFGEAYTAAIPLFRVLVMGAAFLGFFMVNSAFFQGLGRPGTPMKILFIAAFIDIVLNILLIPSQGVMGAAYATTFASGLAGIVSTAILAKYLNTIG